MEGRSVYQRTKEDDALPVCEGSPHLVAATAAPILCQGGMCWAWCCSPPERGASRRERIQAGADCGGLLGRHMEA